MALGVLFGVAQAGLGIMQGMAANAAAEQEYVNQRAQQDANNKFALWQAGFNAKVNDANNQYKYWAETINYNQQLSFAKAQRNVEILKSIRQAEVVAETRAAAGSAYVLDAQAMSQQMAEASMQEAVALQQYQWRALQARSSVQAMNMEGNSVDRLVNDYARQLGEQETLASINQGLRTRQYTREQAGQIAQYLSRWNSQQFYEEAQVFDPVAPFAPLPTMITPGGPTYTGSGPSGAAAALNIGTAVLGGISSGISMSNTLKSMKTPSSGTGPGTPKGG